MYGPSRPHRQEGGENVLPFPEGRIAREHQVRMALARSGKEFGEIAFEMLPVTEKERRYADAPIATTVEARRARA